MRLNPVSKRVLLLALLLPGLVHADPVQRLKAFYDATPAMKGQFKQTVLDRNGRKLQEVSGLMQLQRPGKFRWDYKTPYVQLIVGDGHKVWVYDPDLNQVTVRTLDKLLGASPAALLAGNLDVEKIFDLKDAGKQDDLEWVQATPKDKDGGFDHVLLGFRGDQLAEMELHDNFSQTTVIEFTALERNPKISPKAFHFVPPAGADVVGD
jgi:outer membrane lipoprotein carrier protein